MNDPITAYREALDRYIADMRIVHKDNPRMLALIDAWDAASHGTDQHLRALEAIDAPTS